MTDHRSSQTSGMANPYLQRLLFLHHRVEIAVYQAILESITNLYTRSQSKYLSLAQIRKSLSSLKINRESSRYILADLKECGFLIHTPRKGYLVSPSLVGNLELPYRQGKANRPQ